MQMLSVRKKIVSENEFSQFLVYKNMNAFPQMYLPPKKNFLEIKKVTLDSVTSSRFHDVGTLMSMSTKDKPENRQEAGGSTPSKGSKISDVLAILPTGYQTVQDEKLKIKTYVLEIPVKDIIQM